MLMLSRFVPWGVRDVEFEVEAPSWGPPLPRRSLVVRAVAGGLAFLATGASAVVLAAGLRGLRAGQGFAIATTVRSLLQPASVGEWTSVFGLLVLAGLGGLATAATVAARRGVEPSRLRE